MRWEDERYVRLYTRDTIDWAMLSFEAQGLFSLLLRKVDRAGLLELGKHGKRGVAAAVGHPGRWEVLAPALEELLADGCVSISGTTLVIPNFIEAQEARASDAQRKRDQRERDRDIAKAQGFVGSKAGADIVAAVDRELSRNVTDCPAGGQEVTPDVTRGHTESQAVTPSRAVPSVPSRAVPSEEEAPPPPDQVSAFGAARVGPDTVKQLAFRRETDFPAMPVEYQAPDKSPDEWLAEDFFAWAQSVRQENGYMGEPRRPKNLSSWYSAALMSLNGNVEMLQEAFYRYGQSPHWENRTPPFPFAGFISQWVDFVPRGAAHAS